MNETTRKHYLTHLDNLIETHSKEADEHGHVEDDVAEGLIAWGSTAIKKIAGIQSDYYERLQSIMQASFIPSYKAKLLIGVIKALRSDLQLGFLNTFSGLVRGDTFNSYLDMVEHLLRDGYKDAAAVIAGSTLEAHLRQLAQNHQVELLDRNGKARATSQLNQDLGKRAYKLFEQNQVTTWLGLRNHAAHGKYNEYKIDDVERFVLWLRSFIDSFPA